MDHLSAPDMPAEIIPPATRLIALADRFQLKAGGELHRARLGYETWGRLSPARDNAILLLGGFSASAHAASNADDPSAGWWERMIGPGKPIDTDRWFVICIASLGGCFGSTGPASTNPATGQRYRLGFPEISIEDTVEAAVQAVRRLGIAQLACVIGTSMGGMTALSLLCRHPGIARSHINISGACQATAFAIAIRSLQRQAITSDPEWREGYYSHAAMPRAGMRLARMLGTLSYRAVEEWDIRFGRTPIGKERTPSTPKASFAPEFMIENYLQQQADRFIGRYDPNCYLYLSRAIDRFDLGDHTGGDIMAALSRAAIDQALVIGVTSDLLFPLCQQEMIAEGLHRGDVATETLRITSLRGHDAFLADFEQFGPPIGRFLTSIACRQPACANA